MMESLNVLDDTHSRKVAILGDMGELGPQSDTLHASVGKHLKNLHVDILVTIGTLSTALHEAAKKSAPQTRCLHFADVKRTFAIRFRYLLMNAVALRPVSGSF